MVISVCISRSLDHTDTSTARRSRESKAKGKGEKWKALRPKILAKKAGNYGFAVQGEMVQGKVKTQYAKRKTPVSARSWR